MRERGFLLHKWVALFLVIAILGFAEENSAIKKLENITEIIASKLTSDTPNDAETDNSFGMDKNNTQVIQLLIERKKELEDILKVDSIWSKVYSNYHTYLYLLNEQQILQQQIEELGKKKKKSKKEHLKLENLEEEKSTIDGKLQLLTEYSHDPFQELIKPTALEETPTVTNPIAIINAMSFKKKLLTDQEEYNKRYISLKNIVSSFEEEVKIYQELMRLNQDNNYDEKINTIQERLKTYKPALEIFATTKDVYDKNVDEIKIKINSEISKEVQKSAIIGGVVLFFFALFLFGKFLARRYMATNDRFYMINKALNISFVTVFILILLFSYIENVSYLVTVLGFASAGIAIAMKDWFMSIMGWFVIVIGGTIHVGDRVKFVRNGVEYVGDIVDISMMRMTLHEDVTLTTYMLNRRAGRMIFIPNNYIFTDMIANYAHAGLKTVWDGIDFMITFDSDISKAASIAKDASKKYSKGYTDITRKQLNKLRSSYSIRNTNVEPRILTFIEPYGIKISVWYLTNAYATLTLRSTISQEIIERIQAEECIKLAFPTQSIYMDKDVQKPHFPQKATHSSIIEEMNS